MKWLVGALLVAAACFPLPDLTGRACDEAHACGDGYACVQGRCCGSCAAGDAGALDAGTFDAGVGRVVANLIKNGDFSSPDASVWELLLSRSADGGLPRLDGGRMEWQPADGGFLLLTRTDEHWMAGMTLHLTFHRVTTPGLYCANGRRNTNTSPAPEITLHVYEPTAPFRIVDDGGYPFTRPGTPAWATMHSSIWVPPSDAGFFIDYGVHTNDSRLEFDDAELYLSDSGICP